MKRTFIALAVLVTALVTSCSGPSIPLPGHTPTAASHAAASPKHPSRYTDWTLSNSWAAEPNAKPPLAAASVTWTEDIWIDADYHGTWAYTDGPRTGDPNARGNSDAALVTWRWAKPKLSNLPTDPVQLRAALDGYADGDFDLAVVAINLIALAYTTPELRSALFQVLASLSFAAPGQQGTRPSLTLKPAGSSGAVDLVWDPEHSELSQYTVRHLDRAGHETSREDHRLQHPSVIAELGKRP